MFFNRGQSFNGLKHLTEKVTAVASLTRVWGSPRSQLLSC